MTELLILGAFAAGLLCCLLWKASLLWALLFGYALFFTYGLLRHLTPKKLFSLSLSGVRTILPILTTFLLIGMITAVWRACGTIPYLIYYLARLIVPSLLYLMIFLLCCLLSFLTGTSFGTAATAGVLSMAIAMAANASPVLAGGAILAGSFFGDRCSPTSTSALLVATVTKTDLYRNLRAMFRSALVPFLAACLVYVAFGLLSGGGGASPALLEKFPQAFRFSILNLIPAVLVLVLAACRIPVRRVLGASVAVGCVLCLTLQKIALVPLLRLLILGYAPQDPALTALLSGGGVRSMLRVGAIVCLSSSYSGLFEGTGLLCGIQGRIERLARRITPYGAVLVTSVLTNMAACNQTLSIMLTNQLCGGLEPDRERFALQLENTAVVIAPLIPWSIAGATPLATVGAPTASIFAASYLFFLPVWGFFLALREQKKSR